MTNVIVLERVTKKNNMKKFINEFKTFALRGNALDLAVGVVIGAAFNQITTSLANNILTPPIGLLLGGVDFAKLSVSLGGKAEVGYGLFLQAILNFLIIAVALFVLIKLINKLTRRQAEEKKATPADSPELLVLKEIRDSLQTKTKTK